MKGKEELITGIKAGYPFFYIESQEVNKTLKDMTSFLSDYAEKAKNGIEYQVKTWDHEENNEYRDPDEVIEILENSGTGTIMVAKNFHWFLSDEYNNFSKSKVSYLLNHASKFSSKDFREILIIIGQEDYEGAIPDVLRREFAKVNFPLPNEEEIGKIYTYIVDSAKANPRFKVPDEKTKARIISGAKGLTESEIVKVFSYSIIKNGGDFNPQTVEELRSEEINSTPGLKIGKYDKSLDELKGYEIAKEVVDEWIDDPEAKGILLLGPAGVGKTHFCQALASHYNRLIIEMEFAGLMGDGLVGQAEKAMKKALDIISANANPNFPIIVFIDEIEKSLAGTSGAGSRSGASDGGTTDRSNAQFLKFLSDARPKGVYIVASCNDIEKLPAAYVRAERWDTAPIFVDLPNKDEQASILGHYQKVYGITEKPKDMTNWTGAEIKTWCRLAAKKKSLHKKASCADELIVPIARTMNNEIDYLRKWAKGRTIPASRNQEPGKGK